MAQVAISRCSDYRPEDVARAVRESVALLGGMSAFVQPGQKVMLKINLLSAAPPEKAITTHPAVVEAVVRLVQEAGGLPLIADSPGHSVPYNRMGLRRAYRITGMLEVAERTGAALNWDTATAQVSHPAGRLTKRLDVIKPLQECEVVISLPKLKTHVLTTLTGAVKNLFGVIAGYNKAVYHAKLHSLSHFSGMLLDIVSYVKPALTVMDAIVGMEGNGPGGGPPKKIGAILASQDGVVLDVVAARIVGLDPLAVPTLKQAGERGWWSGRAEDIETLGATIQEVFVADFVKPVIGPRVDMSFGVPLLDNHVRPFLVNLVTLRPVPKNGRCTACGICQRSCPEQVISINDGLAVMDYRGCIRCYCCHELCPEGAIDLERSGLGRFIPLGAH